MRLFAIANISNAKDTIGFRLLDVDTKQIKDVPIENVKGVLKSGNVQIDNLKIAEGKIIGSNGSIDRLPKIFNGQLVGKSPLIIINQLDDVGYTITDFKGTIAKVKKAAVVEYAKAQGIANGKVVSKEGTEFISAIEGNYIIEHIETTQEKKDETDKKAEESPKKVTRKKSDKFYTGELIEGVKPLLPVLKGTVVRAYNQYNELPSNMLIKYENEKLQISSGDHLIRTIKKKIYKKIQHITLRNIHLQG